MPMITKAEATVLFNAFNSQAALSERVSRQIRDAAAAGLSSVTISYGGTPNAVAQAVGTELTNAGWTVNVNTTEKTVTVS